MRYLVGAAGALGSLGQGLGSTFGAGWGTAALSALGLSDERAKEDVREVGILHNGLPVYAYRYKGQPQTQIGLLAQDVAQVKPNAVGLLGDTGMMRVDYESAVA